MKDDEETGFIDVVGSPDIKTEPDSEPREWYVKRPSPEVINYEETGFVRDLTSGMTMADTAWAEMCEHMRALFLLVEASPVELEGGEGVNMFCRTCDRGALDVEQAAGRSKA